MTAAPRPHPTTPAATDGHTTVTVTQGNNRTPDEFEGSAQTWSTLLAALKEFCER